MVSKHETAGRLRRFRDEVEDLMAAVEAGKDKQQLRATLKDLKERMRSEYQKCSTIRVQKAMDHFERAFYYPAIHEAWVAISSAKVNANPSSWHDALYDTHLQLNFYLQQLDG